jgi:hypothetical protein
VGMIVASASYINFFWEILKKIAKEINIPTILIDDASLLPPWIASDHEEYAAYTLRKKYWLWVSQLKKEEENRNF